jgi:peptidoglycan/xylan/chitin deacetylase (PgdA/CDA1 family)
MGCVTTMPSGAGSSSNDRLALCYHAVSDGWASHLSVPTGAFESQLRSLAARSYRSVGFTELVNGPRGTGRAVAITFDDGYRSVLQHAFPILERLGMTATVFVPTDYVDSGEPATWPGMEQWVGTPQASELELLTWDELRTLASAGWEVGSHTRSHRRLVELDEDELDAELRGSRLICEERLQLPCRSLAYPYGAFGTDVDQSTAEAAAQAGYEAAGTVPRRLWPVDPLLWPRVAVGAADSGATFHAKISPWVRRFRATRAWPALSAPRRIVRDRIVEAPERAVTGRREP